MRIGIQTWGSEGDIRPMVALAAGLADRGHTVTVAVAGPPRPEHVDAARRHGFTMHVTPVPGLDAPGALDALTTAWVDAGNPVRQAEMILAAAVDPAVDHLTAAAHDLCATSDLVVGHFFVHPLPAVAEKRGVPLVALHLARTGLPSRHVTPPGFPFLGQLGNRLAWRLTGTVINRIFRARVNQSRTREGLPPIDDVMGEAWASRDLTLVADSAAVWPRPTDWPESHQVCGFLDLPDSLGGNGVSPTLAQFLEEGDSPVYFTFGSLMPHGADRGRGIAEIWRDAARQADCRAILQLPEWADEGRSPDGQALIVHRAAHAAVFPRCAAVVHHGGAGTVHATLRAGVPSVVVPHVADQFFWGAELRRLGVATGVIERKRLATPRLAAALRLAVQTPGFAARARELQGPLLAERGVDRAVELIEAVSAKPIRHGRRTDNGKR